MARKKKPEYDRLNKVIQVALTAQEFKIFDRIRRETSYATIASYARSILLEKIKKQMQTELM